MKFFKMICRDLVYMTPRFYTEEAVFDVNEDGKWFPVCALDHLDDGDGHSGLKVGFVKAFQWMSIGFAYKQETNLRPYRGKNGDLD